MDFFVVFSKVLVIFILILIGYTARKKIVSAEGQRDITNLLLYVFLPCTLLRAFNTTFEAKTFMSASSIMLIMFVTYTFATISSIIISKFFTSEKPKQAIFIMALTLPNVGFMGYPVISSLLGEEYVFYAVIANVIFEFLSWGVMVSIIQKYTNSNVKNSFLKQILSTPALIAIFLGMILYFSPFTIPEPFISVINLLANAMTPVAMIIVGMSLAKANLKKVIIKKELYIVSIFRLIIYPSILMIILKFLGFNDVILSIPTILFAMPSAGYCAMLAHKFGADDTFASEIITISSLLSMISIPFLLSFL